MKYRIPDNIGEMCCATPWKSKGFTDDYSIMSDRVLKSLWEATDGGRLPVVCDASSCTEGLEVMREKVIKALEHKIVNGLKPGEPDFSRLRMYDAVQFRRRQHAGQADRVCSPAVDCTAPDLLHDSPGYSACV